MWRNEQRNLEAEARVLVEQLRDLVASNATFIYCMTEYTTNLVFFKCYYIVK